MDNLSEIPQNQILGMLSKALRGGKDVMNYPGKLPDSVPLLGGMGAGDLIFGKGPELMEDMSYGSPPYKGSGWATQVDPRTVDLAFAPGVGSATSLALRGVKSVPKAVANAATNEGRRDFLKKAAALGAVAVTPDIVSRALREVPIGSTLAKEAAPAAAAQVAKTAWTPALMKQALPTLSKFSLGGEDIQLTDEIANLMAKKYATFDEFNNSKAYMDLWDEPPNASLDNAAVKAELMAHPKYIPNDYGYQGLSREEYHAIMDKHTTSTPEHAAWERAKRILDAYPNDKLDEIIKLGPNNIPKELVSAGVKPEHIMFKRHPLMDEDVDLDDLEDALYRQVYGED